MGEGGKELSGGQRQAVALARALVHDPEILILDEPTSNMDTESELKLQRRLLSVARGRTLVLVTHRLSMLRVVERIIVMDKGKVLYDGPKDACDFIPREEQMPVAARGRPARPQPGAAQQHVARGG